MPKTIHILASAQLPDEGQFIKRFRVKSSSSEKLYIIAQHAVDRWWGCSCQGWVTSGRKSGDAFRNCAHLRDIGLVGSLKPQEIRLVAGGAMGAGDQVAIGQVEGGVSDNAVATLGRRKIEM